MSSNDPSPAARGTGDAFHQWYMNDVGSFALLSAEQERRLGRAIQAGRHAWQEREQLRNTDATANPSGTERRRLDWLVREGRSARDRLVQANLRLVVYVARKYPQYGLPIEDLVQEGNLGLIKAAERFDPERGVRFSTFAVYWIRQTMRVALAQQGHWLGVPAKVRRQLAQLSAAKSSLAGQLGRRPDPEQLAQETGLSIPRIRKLELWGRRALELDREIGEPGGARFGDLLPAPEQEQPQQRATRSLLRERIWNAVASLPDDEARVLTLCFGLETGQALSCVEVGRRMKLSASRIRQLRNRALRMLRHPSRGSDLVA